MSEPGKSEQKTPGVIEGTRVNDELFDRVINVLRESSSTGEEQNFVYHAQFRLDDFADFLEGFLPGFQGQTPQQMFERLDYVSSEDDPEDGSIYYRALAGRYTSPRFAVPLLVGYWSGEGTTREHYEPVPTAYMERVLRQLGVLTDAQNLEDLKSFPRFSEGQGRGVDRNIAYGLDTNISSGIKVTVDFSPNDPQVQLEVDPLAVISK